MHTYPSRGRGRGPHQAINNAWLEAIFATTAGRPRGSFLADPAKKSRPPGLHDPPDDACASRRGAGLAFAVVDPKPMLKITKCAVRLAVIAQRGASGRHCLVQHIRN